MATVRKNELASRIATKMKVSTTQAQSSLNAALDTIREALANGDRLVLTGFGTFEVRQVKERKVRAIRGGGMVTVPAHKRVGFTPGEELTKAVTGGR